jgi:sulfonate transport system permease protein
MSASAGTITAPAPTRAAHTPMRPSRRRKLLPPVLALALPATLLALWAAATQQGWVARLILPAPGAVFVALQDMAHSGDLTTNLVISLRRVLAGFALGAAAGLATGALMGLSRTAEILLRPSLMGFVQVPVLAWIPLLMIPFGIGETLKLAAIGIAAFTPVLVHTAKGFRQVPPALIEVGMLYRFTWPQRVRHILLPGALPALSTGLRLGLTQAWQSLVVVELVASTEGIGYLAVMARQMFQLDVMLATMLVIGLVGFSLDRTLRAAENTLARRYGAEAP